MIQTIKNLIKYKAFNIPEKTSREAYNLWADNYDNQPDNLMFHLDQLVFTELMRHIVIKDKVVADMGCGTGRHWPMLFRKLPQSITGYDVSEGMLNRLQLKFPDAHTVKITDNFLKDIADKTYDLVISTLTIAHIENIEDALSEWCRVLKNGGDMIITDFHPNALSAGGKRTFQYRNEHIPIRNFVHTVPYLKEILNDNGLVIASHLERVIDHNVMPYYIRQDAMHVYQKFKGMPMLYGLHIKKI